MLGIKVTSSSGKRIIYMCSKCYKKEANEVELATEYNLIQKPIVTNIEQCEMHCQEQKNDAVSIGKRK